jgi:hypothetical protein
MTLPSLAIPTAVLYGIAYQADIEADVTFPELAPVVSPRVALARQGETVW